MSFLIDPYRFGGGGGATVGEALYAVGQFSVDFSTATTVDLTVAGLGWTPKAAIFWFGLNTALDTNQDSAVWSVGGTDGISQFVTTFTSLHNANSTDTRQYGGASNVIAGRNLGSASLGQSAAFDSFIANGVRLNITTTAATTRYVNVMFFGGADLQSKVVQTTMPGASGTKSVNVGFEPNLVFLSHNIWNAASDTAGTFSEGHGTHGSGFATWDGSAVLQSCFSYGEPQGASEGDPRAELNDTSIMVDVNGSGELKAQNFGATGFDLVEQGAVDLSGASANILALNLSNNKAWCGVEDLPTTSGDHTFDGPGFTPAACIMVPTMMSLIQLATGANAGSYATSIFDGSDEACLDLSNQDNSATTDVSQVTSTSAIDVDDHFGSDKIKATFSSFDAMGPTLNFTGTDAGTTRKSILVAFGDG